MATGPARVVASADDLFHVQSGEVGGSGEVWIRGLLVDGDIYILAAWNRRGGVWGNPDYIAFFNSFQPWVD